MKNRYISNKTLIIRIVLSVLLISVVVLFISSEYLKKTAVDNLALDDAKKTAKLVFETMNTRMQEGWKKDDLNEIIQRLEIIRTGMKINSYRSPLVEELFGVIPEDKKISQSDPLIIQAMNGEEVFKINKETGAIRFLYPMKVSSDCTRCHVNASNGSINGVLDITFPQSEIKISLDIIFSYIIGFFVLFLLVISYVFFMVINKKMVEPVVHLTDKILEIQSSKNLTKRVDIKSNIKEVGLLQLHFNNLLITIKYYYDRLIASIYTDDLTSINNLSKLQYDLETKNNHLSLMVLDIKSFGRLNQVYGKKVSEFILKEFTKNINTILKNNGVLYRLYADELAVVYNSKLTHKEVVEFSEIIKEFSYTYKKSSFMLDTTIGYAYGNNKDVFSNATLALKEAKKRKCAIFEFNETIAIEDENNDHMNWLNKLDAAIEHDQIVPYFMPIKNTKTGLIDKYETLVRIVENGNIHTPDKFLDIAISSGKYHIITQIMIKKVFEYFKDIDNVKFSINIGISDITNATTMKILFDNLESYNYSSNVIIELLETEEISDFELLHSFIKKVKNYNARIAIDDFGSGYSNFNYIINLDIDIVKLDSSLIENMYTDQHSVVVVSNIVKTIKELGLEVVAEKVFSPEIEQILTIHEVDYLQGYEIGKAQREINK